MRILQARRPGQTVVDAPGGDVQVGVAAEKADAVLNQDGRCPADGAFVRQGFYWVEEQRVVGDHQLGPHGHGLPAYVLEGV